MAFENDESLSEIDVDKAKLKKVSSRKSIFEKSNKPSKEEFEKKVTASENNRSNYANQFIEYSKKYLNILNDKTLKENKNILVRELERTFLSEMLKLTKDVNNDENEEDNQGSLGLMSILLQANVLQRNHINLLEYNADLLKKEFAQLKKQVEVFSSKLEISKE